MGPAAEPPGGSRGSGPSRRRELLFRGIALGFGVTAGLLGMEGLARLVLTDFYACDPALGWTFEPGRSGFKFDRRLEYAVRTRINSAGFHDVEHTLEKPPDTLRVVLLGDSMLAGMQVPLEQGFARRLEAALNEPGGLPRFEVVNCATDGFGTAQALLMFEERCRHYRPDLVLLGFFPISDVLDNYWGARSLNHPVARKCGRPYFELRDAQLARVGDMPSASADPASPLVDRVLRRSYLYQVIAPVPGDPGKPKFRLHDMYLRDYSPEQWQAWEVTQELLRALDEAVRGRGARFGVLLVPSRAEVDPAHARGVRGAHRMDFERPGQIVARFLSEQGVDYLEVGDGLREAVARAEGPPLYFERDMHWTGPGNGLAAELVARWARSLYSRGSPEPAPSARPASF